MVYLFFGKDIRQSHERLNQFVAKFLKEKKISLFKVDENNFDESFFNGLLKTNNLFGGTNLVVVRRLFNNSSSSVFLLGNLERLSSSDNLFVFWEEDIEKDHLELIKSCAEDVAEFSLKKEKKHKDNSLFRLADCFAAKQKEKTWLLHQEELLKGTASEEIFWKLLWQIKSLILVKRGGGSSLHPFVLNKIKKATLLFAESELQKYFSDLIDLFHQSRLGQADLSVGLEKFILKI